MNGRRPVVKSARGVCSILLHGATGISEGCVGRIRLGLNVAVNLPLVRDTVVEVHEECTQSYSHPQSALVSPITLPETSVPIGPHLDSDFGRSMSTSNAAERNNGRI